MQFEGQRSLMKVGILAYDFTQCGCILRNYGRGWSSYPDSVKQWRKCAKDCY